MPNFSRIMRAELDKFKVQYGYAKRENTSIREVGEVVLFWRWLATVEKEDSGANYYIRFCSGFRLPFSLPGEWLRIMDPCDIVKVRVGG